MTMDIHLLMEVKKNGVWTLLGKEMPYGFEPKESVLQSTTLISLVFCGRHLYGGYEDDKVPTMYVEKNGSPLDMSRQTEVYLNETFVAIDGHVTKADIQKFNWDFDIPFDVAVSPEEREEYLKTGKIPEYYAVSGMRLVNLKFQVPFKQEYESWFEELKELESLGEDFRYLYYFE